MLKWSDEQIKRLYQLSQQDEFKTLLDWMKASADKITRDALQSADARACGAAAMLQDLTDLLGSVETLYKDRRNTTAPPHFD